jgi:signal transduction histidine kinase
MDVQDNGVGFDVNGVRRGWGFISVDARVRLAGGTWEVDAAAGRGAKLSVFLPMDEADEGP